jgi:hypothetical protein
LACTSPRRRCCARCCRRWCRWQRRFWRENENTRATKCVRKCCVSH